MSNLDLLLVILGAVLTIIGVEGVSCAVLLALIRRRQHRDRHRE